MDKYSDNYYYRKCFLERNQVPTQRVIKKTMGPALAEAYFKSMIPPLKVLAGLEPPLRGGGSDWYVPPVDLLKGRAVKKPIQKKCLSKLSSDGICLFRDRLVGNFHRELDEEEKEALLNNDEQWKEKIVAASHQVWKDAATRAQSENTAKIQLALEEFTTMYSSSINKIENILYEAATKEIESIRDEAYEHMKNEFRVLVKQQATMLYDRYTEKLLRQKESLKSKFIKDLEQNREEVATKVHDTNVGKHVAIEKLRSLLECINLACQVYVALKERQACEKEVELSKHKHEKDIKVLTKQIAAKDREIRLASEKENKRIAFNEVWKKKVCLVLKKFQMFVSYSLKLLPEHADFFLNAEKLVMLQLDEALEEPSVESLFVEEEDEKFHTPVPRPHPLFLFCDKGYKPNIDQSLCPKHCTSSASQLPVVVINKKCVYAACDNFELFTDKIKQYISGDGGEHIDVEDDRDYTHDVPVKYTSVENLLELKLESSLMHLLLSEIPNVKEVPVECGMCRLPYCFCSPPKPATTPQPQEEPQPPLPFPIPLPPGRKITSDIALQHEREPKWESYIDFAMPTRCRCVKRAKKHLEEHLPPYMKTMSKFASPGLPHYEPCSLAQLKKIVEKARGEITPPPEPARAESNTKEISTQCSDLETDLMCTCFSQDELKRLCQDLLVGQRSDQEVKVLGSEMSKEHLDKTASSFATEQAHLLSEIVKGAPELKEIFRKPNCDFETLSLCK